MNAMQGGPGEAPIWPALVPLAAYFLAIGLLHLRRRPSALAGGWDAVGVSGAVAAAVVLGPIDLLLPASIVGAWRWVLAIGCFFLLVVTVQLASRPRLVVYNVSIEQLRPIVARVATALDPLARWAGETVALPGRDVQVHLDGRGGMRSVSLVTLGSRTSPEGWVEFSRRLRRAVREQRVSPSPWAGLFLVAALALGSLAALLAWRAQRTAAEPSTAPAGLVSRAAPPLASPPPIPGVHHAGARRPLGA